MLPISHLGFLGHYEVDPKYPSPTNMLRKNAAEDRSINATTIAPASTN